MNKEDLYMSMCRDGIVEDYMNLGDDNINTIINVYKAIKECLQSIYNKAI